MSPPVRVALLGFTPFERQHLEPALRAPRQRKPVYAVRVEELPSCSLAVVDADHEPAVAQVLRQQRLASTVMVGRTPRPGAGAQLSRPIQLPALLQALDELVAAAPPMSAEVLRVHEALASLLPQQDRQVSTAAVARTAARGEARATAGPARAAGWPIIAGPQADRRRGRALLVDGRDSSLRFLSHELDPRDLDVQRVMGGSEALQRLQQEAFDFVFLATGDPSPDNADGMNGFHTCRLLQRMPPAVPKAPPPTLVLLLADDSAVSRLRAERAGADAWLAAPWSVEPLLKIVDERERWVQQSVQRG